VSVFRVTVLNFYNKVGMDSTGKEPPC
jgi:hypothetical protein